jgi:hypothetical protein
MAAKSMQAEARFLDGSSGINGRLCIRGGETDYDAWNLASLERRNVPLYVGGESQSAGCSWDQRHTLQSAASTYLR